MHQKSFESFFNNITNLQKKADEQLQTQTLKADLNKTTNNNLPKKMLFKQRYSGAIGP